MYYAKINWYDEFNDSDVIQHILIIAEDWNEAMNRVSMRFFNVNSIHLEYLGYSDGIIFLPDDVAAQVKEFNIV